MSAEGGGGNISSKRGEEGGESKTVASTPERGIFKSEETSPPSDRTEPSTPGDDITGRLSGEGRRHCQGSEEITGEESKPTARSDRPTQAIASLDAEEKPRQVIAVSASKGPAAFFNLARKFLVTDEMCDLSALEGAIVSAVDAAHLLERSKLATIVRVQTAYVTVEPKKKKQQQKTHEALAPEGQAQQGLSASISSAQGPLSTYAAAASPQAAVPPEGHRTSSQGDVAARPRQKGAKGSSGGRELRRARIVITVKRTDEYKQWLDENPLQAIIAGDADEDVDPNTSKADALPGKTIS